MPDAVPQSHIFGGGVTASVMTPTILVLLLVLGLLILVLPRKFVIIPFLSGAFLIWLGAQFYFAGVHWLALRILVLITVARMIVSRPKVEDEGSRIVGGLNEIDRAFFFCVLTQAVCVLLLFRQTEALVNQLGFLIDFLGGYFAIRFLIRDESDLYRALKWLAILSVVLAVGMVIEQLKLINYFALVAGVAQTPEIREGKIRSQGVFQHAIPAGTVAATWIPLFLLLWKNGKSKVMGGLGLIGATVMTITSQSSTPLLAYAAGFLGIGCWFLREKMRVVRWSIVLSVAGLAVVMKAPVWFVLAHINLTGGSSGYHRAELVDQFIRHFWEWCLIGVKDTSQWGWDMWDVQNQYIAIGESGGLLAFCFFIALVTRCYVRLGNARKKIAGDKNQEWLLWFLACTLFSNTLAFIGANYFDQSRISWFLTIAWICAATAPILREHAEAVSPLELASAQTRRARLSSAVAQVDAEVRWR
jgi:hypothetical protein